MDVVVVGDSSLRLSLLELLILDSVVAEVENRSRFLLVLQRVIPTWVYRMVIINNGRRKSRKK